MEYLSNLGFLGTPASYFMDSIVVYLLLLPILIIFSISLAKSRNYGLNRFIQTVLFLLMLISIITFNYNVYMMKRFDSTETTIFFIIEMLLSLVTLIFWLSTLLFAIEDRRRKALPGFYSRSHKASGRRLFFIILIDIMVILLLYWMVYVS
jgi:hypothetical protein